jgi:hypothetical protein
MRDTLALFGLSLLLLTGGCAPMPDVALDATPADLEMLAGEWEGEYSSAALGRRGSIEFSLKAGTAEAHGDVLMIPQGRRTPYQPRSYGDAPERGGRVESPEVLTIRFIRASAGSISGMLDRYWDPDRNCYAHTVFRGHLAVGSVEGTFTTTFDCGAGEATGTWKATRKTAKRSSARR